MGYDKVLNIYVGRRTHNAPSQTTRRTLSEFSINFAVSRRSANARHTGRRQRQKTKPELHRIVRPRVAPHMREERHQHGL